MARKGRMCAVPECERRAAPGAVVCSEHRHTALGAETDREIRLMTQRLTALAKLEEVEEKSEAATLFRRQVARGDYAALFSTKLVSLLDEAGVEGDLQREIGALRVGMVRLLMEEKDPSRMAHALAKLSNALGRAMQIQDEWDERGRKVRNQRELLDQHVQWLEGVRAEQERRRRPQTVEPVEVEYKPLEWPPMRVSYEEEGEFEE